MDDVSQPASDKSAVSFDEHPPTTNDRNNSAASADPSSNDVLSRLSMSEEQREIKRRFEEKQRDEARRSAHAERIAKKKANLWNSVSFEFFSRFSCYYVLCEMH